MTQQTAIQHLEDLIDQLHQGGRLRVWSIAITIFGDAIVPRGGEISLVALQEVMGRMRIEPNAVRTAISRLAKDGWILRRKCGRQSYYRLAPEGMESFEHATRKIYSASAPEWSGRFEGLIVSRGDARVSERKLRELERSGYGSPSTGLYLRPVTGFEDKKVVEGLSRFTTDDLQIPNLQMFARDVWKLDVLENSYEEFLKRYSHLFESWHAQNTLSPLESLVARVLLIHDWRRLVLKDPWLPQAFLPESWIGHRAREVTRELYELLLAESEKWLEHCEDGETGNLTQPGPDFFLRFKE